MSHHHHNHHHYQFRSRFQKWMGTWIYGFLTFAYLTQHDCLHDISIYGILLSHNEKWNYAFCWKMDETVDSHVLGFELKLWFIWSWFLYKLRDSFRHLHVDKQFFQHHFLKRSYFSPVLVFRSFVKDHMDIAVWFYFCVFYSISLVFMSVFVPVPCCFHYCGSVL
jgi:hypothetical protein